MSVFPFFSQDIATKILSFSQQRPRALCILSASGTVSSVTLRQPTSSSGTVTYEVETPNLSLFLFFPPSPSFLQSLSIDVMIYNPTKHQLRH